MFHRSNSAKQPRWDGRDLGDGWQLPSRKAVSARASSREGGGISPQAAVLSGSGKSFLKITLVNYTESYRRGFASTLEITKSALPEVMCTLGF